MGCSGMFWEARSIIGDNGPTGGQGGTQELGRLSLPRIPFVLEAAVFPVLTIAIRESYTRLGSPQPVLLPFIGDPQRCVLASQFVQHFATLLLAPLFQIK